MDQLGKAPDLLSRLERLSRIKRYSLLLAFVPSKPFQLCLIFVDKAGAYLNGTPWEGS
jgi:hypothetical protein